MDRKGDVWRLRKRTAAGIASATHGSRPFLSVVRNVRSIWYVLSRSGPEPPEDTETLVTGGHGDERLQETLAGGQNVACESVTRPSAAAERMRTRAPRPRLLYVPDDRAVLPWLNLGWPVSRCARMDRQHPDAFRLISWRSAPRPP